MKDIMKSEKQLLEPKQVLIIRTDTDPKMRKGKMIAQGAHASEKPIFDMMEWIIDVEHVDIGDGATVARPTRRGLFLPIEEGSALEKWVTEIFKKVVCKGTLEQIVGCYQQAQKMGIPCALIEDKGLTEFGGNVTITACSIGPAFPEDIDPITRHLELI
jgi:PTH2 family peptidyl-tRNA hydrolase